MNLNEINRLTIKAYNDAAEKYYNSFKNEINEKEYDRVILDKFSDLLGNNGVILDAGCGPCGHTAAYLAAKGNNVTGIDISENCVKIASANNPGINFITMDMMHTSFKDNSFDGIISYYSIIYTPGEYLPGLFKEFNRILKPCGRLLVVVKKGEHKGFELYEGNKVYFAHFTEEELKKLTSENCFSINLLETRKAYSFEINVERIYQISSKK